MGNSRAHRIDCRFSTQRLTVASWDRDLGDTALRAQLTRDLRALLVPEVLQHLPAPLQCGNGPDAVAAWISDRRAESEVQTVRSSQTGRLLGLLILAPFEEAGEDLVIHIGYLFSAECWGKGFATELVSALVRWCADQPFPVRLIGGVGHGNQASARVLEKAGFAKSKALSDDETDVFELSVA
ncbi:GNAT family N-acetyltransferase [Nitratireductor sp. XY-223]|uniref:GNAT family N-acetyltransferase n=1 Tax=Nitratireductor sp. XY-223 TaxID=2561926 RepID=UPI0010AA9932|nr:GNAT family N-acetyltransferase [Nitratireductor sp. XY-223]